MGTFIGGLVTPATGRGIKLVGGTFAVTGTGALTVTGAAFGIGGGSGGTPTVQSAHASVTNAATTVPTDVATISSYSGNTVNVVVVQLAATANAIETVAKNVDIWAVVFYS